jgi:hypothetical protein
MEKLIRRILIGGGCAALGGAIAGPAGAYAGWKGGGFIATGNPLHLIPGGGLVGDGVDALSGVADAANMADGHSMDGGGLDPNGYEGRRPGGSLWD